METSKVPRNDNGIFAGVLEYDPIENGISHSKYDVIENDDRTLLIESSGL